MCAALRRSCCAHVLTCDAAHAPSAVLALLLLLRRRGKLAGGGRRVERRALAERLHCVCPLQERVGGDGDAKLGHVLHLRHGELLAVPAGDPLAAGEADAKAPRRVLRRGGGMLLAAFLLLHARPATAAAIGHEERWEPGGERGLQGQPLAGGCASTAFGRRPRTLLPGRAGWA